MLLVENLNERLRSSLPGTNDAFAPGAPPHRETSLRSRAADALTGVQRGVMRITSCCRSPAARAPSNAPNCDVPNTGHARSRTPATATAAAQASLFYGIKLDAHLVGSRDLGGFDRISH